MVDDLKGFGESQEVSYSTSSSVVQGFTAEQIQKLA